MLTQQTRNALRQQGHSDEDIDKMPVDVAMALAGQQVDSAPPEKEEHRQQREHRELQAETARKAKTAGMFVKKIGL